jgi:hypothetical protein
MVPVDFGPPPILMRHDNFHIFHARSDSETFRKRHISHQTGFSVDSDQLRALGSAYLGQERVKPWRAQRVTTTACCQDIALSDGSSRYHGLVIGHVRRRAFRGVGPRFWIAGACLDRIDYSGGRSRTNTVPCCKSATKDCSHRVRQVVGRMDRSGIPVDALSSLWIIGRSTRFRHRAAVRTRAFAATIWARRNSIALVR